MSHTIYDYMIPHGPQTHVTEPYVSSPPALVILDETGSIWTLGTEMGPAPKGELAFNVLRNGFDTREFASRIERRNGKISIFTRTGRKNWTGHEFV